MIRQQGIDQNTEVKIFLPQLRRSSILGILPDNIAFRNCGDTEFFRRPGGLSKKCHILIRDRKMRGSDLSRRDQGKLRTNIKVYGQRIALQFASRRRAPPEKSRLAHPFARDPELGVHIAGEQFVRRRRVFRRISLFIRLILEDDLLFGEDILVGDGLLRGNTLLGKGLLCGNALLGNGLLRVPFRTLRFFDSCGGSCLSGRHLSAIC